MNGKTAEGLSNMSKAEDLRGFVTERLAAASRDILAAVERTVADYEEQASGFRQEIDRQRRQLELLLEPEVTLSTAGLKPSRSLCPVEEEEGDNEERLKKLDLAGPSRSLPARCHHGRRKPGRPQINETLNHIDLRIRILKDSQTSVLSKNVLKKCPVLKLKCLRGLQEADFLDLLRSAFPQLAGDNKPFDILTSDKRRRLQPLKLKTLTAEEIHRNICCIGSEKSTVYVRLKTQEEPRVGEEEIHPVQTKNNSSAVSVTTLTCEDTRRQTSCLVQEVESRTVGTVCRNSTSQQQDMETEEADEEEPAVERVSRSATEGKGDGTESDEKVNDSWKPDKDDDEPKESDSKLLSKTTKTQEVLKAENSVAALSCKVCGALHKSKVTLVKHAWSHGDGLGSVCGVCGECSEPVEDHLQSHHRTNDCHICGESFLSVLSLNEHVAAHTGARPHACIICHGTFALKVSLEAHQKLHEVGKLHKCYTCHKAFELKEQLKAHRRTHINRKTHLCGVCGKSLSDYRSLSRHKMTHSGERPHSCQICGRRFKLPGTLRQHEKIHTIRERSYLCDVCCKMFLTSKQLQIHMRTHTNEKPYHCGECGKGFTTKGPLTVHMRVHTGETPYRCPDCGWSFKRKTNLDNHVAVHSGIKPFVCGICGKACARKTYLNVHMRTHNGERPYKCSLCDKAFTQSHCLKTHMKSHQGAESVM